MEDLEERKVKAQELIAKRLDQIFYIILTGIVFGIVYISISESFLQGFIGLIFAVIITAGIVGLLSQYILDKT